MTDRERIAGILTDAIERNYLSPLEMADAVLSALDGRLLPELPTVIGEYQLVGCYEVTPQPDGSWWCGVWRNASGDDDLISDGDGPTPAAAIRNALEADR